MEAKIIGGILPALHITLAPGDTVVAEPGEFTWMSPSVTLNTTRKPSGRSSWGKTFGRMLAGGGLFMTEYRAPSGGEIAFAAKMPGHILPIAVRPGSAYFVHKHGFLCAEHDVELTLGVQKSLGAGLFGGDGFLLQKLQGQGTAWVELGGEIIERELAPGEELLVHPGHVGMFEQSVTFDVTMIKGIRNVFFGGNGLFTARLRGPGRIWLQTLTLPNLAGALAPYLGGESSGTAGAGLGGFLLGALGGALRNE